MDPSKPRRGEKFRKVGLLKYGRTKLRLGRRAAKVHQVRKPAKLLGRNRRHFVAQPEVQRQVRSNSVIILKIAGQNTLTQIEGRVPPGHDRVKGAGAIG